MPAVEARLVVVGDRWISRLWRRPSSSAAAIPRQERQREKERDSRLSFCAPVVVELAKTHTDTHTHGDDPNRRRHDASERKRRLHGTRRRMGARGITRSGLGETTAKGQPFLSFSFIDTFQQLWWLLLLCCWCLATGC